MGVNGSVKLVIIMLALLVTTSQSALSSCVNPDPTFFGAAATIRLVNGANAPESFLNQGIDYWEACFEYNFGFPALTASSVSADVTVTVYNWGGHSNKESCGGETGLANGNRVIEIWAQAFKTGTRETINCQPPQWILAHELGHSLGLMNADVACFSYIMSPNPSSVVQPDECSAVDDQRITPKEEATNDPEPPTEEPDPPPPGSPGGPYSPIIIDLEGRGFRLTSFEDGVTFDIDADDLGERIAWTDPTSDEAFLALDRNGNGWIEDGTELFGNFTPQPPSEEPNGFLALAVFDRPENGGNDDGLISAADAIFPELRLWKDLNQDGISQPWELHGLTERGVMALELRYRTAGRRDRHGNFFRWTAMVHFSINKRLAASDVIFVSE